MITDYLTMKAIAIDDKSKTQLRKLLAQMVIDNKLTKVSLLVMVLNKWSAKLCNMENSREIWVNSQKKSIRSI